MITQGQVTYIFRGKEMTFHFYPVQPLERLGLRMRGIRRAVGDGYRFTFTLTPAEEITLLRVSVDMDVSLNQGSRVFANGFQSWTESREYGIRERMPRLRWPATAWSRLVGDSAVHRPSSRQGFVHSWTYTYVKSADGKVVLYGSVSERPGYTLFEIDGTTGVMRVSRECEGLKLREEYTALDIVVLPGGEDEVFDEYSREMYGPEEAIGRTDKAPVSGWSGSRNRTIDVSEPIVLANLNELKKREVPLDLFLIEDGWQGATGDWTEPGPHFPSGMKKITLAAKEAGYRPGLWIAPYVCSRWSQLFRRHHDWLLKDKDNRPVKAGWNGSWGGSFYALDTYHQGLRDYLRQVFATILDEWGFDFVKTDLLYAAGLRPGERKTRGQVMCDALEFLREMAGDRVWMAGGVPLGAAFHSAGYCGIGSETSLRWEHGLRRALGYRERFSTMNALTSLSGRRHLNGRFFAADGGSLVLRSGRQNMTPEQRKTLLRLNLVLSETFFVSDNPAEYSDGEMAMYRSAFPLKKKKVLSADSRRGAWTVRFEVDGRQYVLLANLTPKTAEFRVDPHLYFDPDLGGFGKYELVSCVRPYESRCLLRVPEGEWTIAGGTGHLFPGCEAFLPVIEDGVVRLGLHPHARYETEVFLRVPGHSPTYVVNGKHLKTETTYDMTFVRVRLNPSVR
jgi:alpha-galactosidase